MFDNLRRLWRYNLRIVLGQTYWLLVIPIAVSQLVLFWHMAMAVTFKPVTAARTAELLAPALGAFLCAYVLGPEYQLTGEITFCKPFAVHRLLLLRLFSVWLFVGLLLATMFAGYYFGLGPFPVGITILAAVPSVLFLSLLSLTVATLFRSPGAGLAVAGAYWALDLLGGAGFHPLLTLHGWAERLADKNFSEWWKTSKLCLLGLSLLLYFINGRLMTRPQVPRRRWRTAAKTIGATLVLGLYLYTGAAYKIVVGLREEQTNPLQAWLWYRTQFSMYGPLPVPYLFGPAFGHYIGERPSLSAVLSGTTLSILRTPAAASHLALVAERYPHSLWADNALFELGRCYEYQVDTVTPPEETGALDIYRRLASNYPDSPFSPLALERFARLAAQKGRWKEVEWAHKLFQTHYSSHPEAWTAAELLVNEYRRRGEKKPKWHQRALQIAQRTVRVTSWKRRARALSLLGDLLLEAGQREAARQRYREALQAAEAALQRFQEESFTGSPREFLERRGELASVRREMRQKLAELK